MCFYIIMSNIGDKKTKNKKTNARLEKCKIPFRVGIEPMTSGFEGGCYYHHAVEA